MARFQKGDRIVVVGDGVFIGMKDTVYLVCGAGGLPIIVKLDEPSIFAAFAETELEAET